ncbi:coiled-coil domain-containing protein [Lysinibacillus xylanilyticus]|uniref:hypothetical protein n=1 Tax=Lysinibacillus xylanilyticus TaxID=582475 RepID=UPI0036DB20A6
MKKFKNWRDIISVISFIITIVGFFLALHVYFRDIRPVIENAELYEQVISLKEKKSELQSEVNTTENEIKKLKIQVEQFTNEKDSLQEELVGSYKSYYLDQIYLKLQQKELLSIPFGKEVNLDVREKSLELLNEFNVDDDYKKKGLNEAVAYIEEYITTGSEYIEILNYKKVDLEKKIKELEKAINNP